MNKGGSAKEKTVSISKLIKEHDINTLKQCLNSYSISTRGKAAFAIGELATKGVCDPSVIPVLNNCLADKHYSARRNSAWAIGEYASRGIHDPNSLSLLINLLEDPVPDVRLNAALAVGRLAGLGISDDSAIPLLNSLLYDPDPAIKQVSIQTIGCLAEAGVCDLSSLHAIREYEEEMSDEDLMSMETTIIRRLLETRLIEKRTKQNQMIQDFKAMQLSDIVDIAVPTFMERDTWAEIHVLFRNNTERKLEDITLDTSDLDSFFTVEGEIRIPSLRPGMEVEEDIRIRPLYAKGTFPVNLRLYVGEAGKDYSHTIKVGGTEVY